MLKRLALILSSVTLIAQACFLSFGSASVIEFKNTVLQYRRSFDKAIELLNQIAEQPELMKQGPGNHLISLIRDLQWAAGSGLNVSEIIPLTNKIYFSTDQEEIRKLIIAFNYSMFLTNSMQLQLDVYIGRAEFFEMALDFLVNYKHDNMHALTFISAVSKRRPHVLNMSLDIAKDLRTVRDRLMKSANMGHLVTINDILLRHKMQTDEDVEWLINKLRSFIEPDGSLTRRVQGTTSIGNLLFQLGLFSQNSAFAKKAASFLIENQKALHSYYHSLALIATERHDRTALEDFFDLIYFHAGGADNIKTLERARTEPIPNIEVVHQTKIILIDLYQNSETVRETLQEIFEHNIHRAKFSSASNSFRRDYFLSVGTIISEFIAEAKKSSTVDSTRQIPDSLNDDSKVIELPTCRNVVTFSDRVSE